MEDRPSASDCCVAGKVVVVTGALGLLGSEYCRDLALGGAKVVAADLDPEAIQSFAAALPGAAIGLAFDVTNKKSIEAARAQIEAEFGPIDALINNAAINEKVENPAAPCSAASFESMDLAEWRRVMDVNVTSVFLCCQVFGSEMARLGSGSIINIASTYGIVAPNQSLYLDEQGRQTFFKSPAYPTSKAAVIHLTRYLAAYWGKRGVRVNCLSPGGVENGQSSRFVANYSERTPLARMARPADYTGAIRFLASDASRYMTGANLVVDGGWTTW